MSKNEEKKDLLEFARSMVEDIETTLPERGVRLDDEDMLLWQQLRCLWTAYCLRHGGEPDTAQYDSDFTELYDTLTEAFGVEDVPAPDGSVKNYEDDEDVCIKDELDLWFGAFLA